LFGLTDCPNLSEFAQLVDILVNPQATSSTPALD